MQMNDRVRTVRVVDKTKMLSSGQFRIQQSARDSILCTAYMPNDQRSRLSAPIKGSVLWL